MGLQTPQNNSNCRSVCKKGLPVIHLLPISGVLFKAIFRHSSDFERGNACFFSTFPASFLAGRASIAATLVLFRASIFAARAASVFFLSSASWALNGAHSARSLFACAMSCLSASIRSLCFEI